MRQSKEVEEQFVESDLDDISVSSEEYLTLNVMFAQFLKVNKSRHKYKVELKDWVLHLDDGDRILKNASMEVMEEKPQAEGKVIIDMYNRIQFT